MPALNSLSSTETYYGTAATLSVTQGATVEDGALTTLSDVAVTLDGTGKLGVGQWQSLTDGSIKITAGDYAPTTGSATSSNAFTNLSDIDGSSLYISGGGSLTLSAVQTYTNNDTDGAVFQATDTTSGGTINLPALTAIGGGYAAHIDVAGAQSRIDLPEVTSIDSSYSEIGYNYAALSVTQDGTVEDGSVTSLNGVVVTLDGTGTIAVSQWQSLTDGSLTITGGDYAPTAGAATSDNAFTNLADIDDTSIYVYGNGSLSLPGVTGVAGATLQAYQPNVNSGTRTVGAISLPALTALTGSDVSILAAGSGSTIDLPKLTSITSSAGVLSVTQNATVDAPLLTSLAGIGVTLDGTGTIATSQWQSLTDGGLDITGGDYSPTSGGGGGPFANLDAINGSMLLVSGGGSLTLPKVTSYQPLVDDYLFGQSGNVFLATGKGSMLDLPALASISESGTTYDYTPLGIKASSGGTVELAAPSSIITSGYYAPVSIEADGAGSVVDASALTTYNSDESGYDGAVLAATNGGTIDLNSQLTSLAGVLLTLDGTGTIPISQFTSITDGGIKVEGGDYATGSPLASLTDIDGFEPLCLRRRKPRAARRVGV